MDRSLRRALQLAVTDGPEIEASFCCTPDNDPSEEPMPDIHTFTSESVSEGHPDKVADQISDAVLDACLRLHPMARVAIETLVTTNYVLVAGEVGEVRGVAGIGERVEVHQLLQRGVLLKKTLTDEVAADEAAAAGDEEVHAGRSVVVTGVVRGIRPSASGAGRG
jgi:hypothetical protein